jgi:hypothetical protein
MIKRVRSGFYVIVYDRCGRKVPELCEVFTTEKEAKHYLAIVG